MTKFVTTDVNYLLNKVLIDYRCLWFTENYERIIK